MIRTVGRDLLRINNLLKESAKLGLRCQPPSFFFDIEYCYANPRKFFVFAGITMIFNTSSSKGGELSFLNNTVAAYKDMIDLRRGNLTTIAWEWK